jgi:hypothetical protein
VITDTGLTPLIGMRLGYGNQRGGEDIVPGQNAFYFNLTLTPDRVLSGSSAIFQARRNTFGFNDSISFNSAYSSSGIVQIVDSDSDGFYDRVQWSGDLPAGGLEISFSGLITPGVNFDESLMYVSLDEGTCTSSYAGAQTFTGLTFSGLFSRGPVREGIEILQITTWVARGFIKNTAASLRYILHSWELYEIGNPTPVLSGNPSEYIDAGETETTSWHNTGLTDKPVYYSAAFDWEVVWGASSYSSSSTSSMDLPMLYEMDSWADGYALLQSNGGGGKSVRINISARHLGHSGLYADSVVFNSTLPRFGSGGGGASSWSPSQIRVYYSNGSGEYEITPYASIQTAESNPGNGFVNVTIQSIYSALGHYMGQNDDIILSYLASSPSSSETHSYIFTANVTLITLSGTPVEKTAIPSVFISGVIVTPEPGGGGGGGGGAAQVTQYADIVKESADAFFTTVNTVRVMVSAVVVDNAGKGVKDVKVLAYVPKDSELDIASALLRIFRNSTGRWEEMMPDRDLTVTDRGLTVIGKQEYREYLMKRKTPEGALFESTIDMLGGDRIQAEYKTTVPFGTSFLLTRLMGYSYYEDKLIFEDAYIPVRREAGKLESLQIEESEWMQGPAEIGKPVKWVKTFRIYNPNNASVEEVMQTRVFQDSLSVEYGEIDGEKSKLTLRGGAETIVNWYARGGARERKTYVLEAITPPVLETNREIEIMETNRTNVRIIARITLVNFAREGYSNISLLLPVRRDRILMVSDPAVRIEGSGDQVTIVIPGMEPFETKNLSIMYTEAPPTMAVTLDAIRYGCSDSAKVNIYVVPSDNEVQSYVETQVVGPFPNLITTHAEVVELGGAKAFQEIKIPIRISLASFPTGRYFIYTRFNKDFGTVLSDSKEFEIDCPSRDLRSVSWIFILAAGLFIVALLGIRVYRKRSYRSELEDLRKKVKKI